MRYPWDDWSDGAWHRVSQDDVPKTFREMIRNRARRKGLHVGVRRMSNGDLVFRLGSDTGDGKFVGVNGEEHPFVSDVPKEAESRRW